MLWCSVDPGINHVGIAYWSDKTLVHATLIRNKAPKKSSLSERVHWLSVAVRRYLNSPHAEPVSPCELAVIELPRTYKGKAAKGDANKNVVPLALVVGALIHHIPTVHLVWPNEWKGNMDADVFTERLRGKLTPEQRAATDWPPKSLDHNVIDAIGLGLWWQTKNKII